MTVSAGIYARISSDETGDRLGVSRQLKDCRADAKRRGWRVVEEYVDNDVSATRARVRPEYQRMLTEIRDGRIGALVVWDVDRLTRTPRELEDVIDLADRHGLQLASIGGEIDLATPQGRLTARLKGSVARHEAEQMSRRIRRKFDERASAGAPHGSVAYGYKRLLEVDEHGRRVGARDVIDDEQAAVLRETARRILGGESLRGIAADLNARGVPVPRKGAWSSTTLRQVMLRERNAGIRRHRGKPVGEAAWEPIYNRETHDRVVALLTDPGRKTSRGSTRRHLLTNIARCGRCSGQVIVNVGRMQGGKRQPPAYVCAGCTRVRRKEEAVDAVVEAMVIARLAQPDALAALHSQDPAEVERVRSEASALEARLELAADEYADGAITATQLRRITDRLRPQIDAKRAALAKMAPTGPLADLAGEGVAERWAAAPLEVKRAAIELLMTVTIMPSGPGRAFDPELIKVEWRTQ